VQRLVPRKGLAQQGDFLSAGKNWCGGQEFWIGFCGFEQKSVSKIQTINEAQTGSKAPGKEIRRQDTGVGA